MNPAATRRRAGCLVAAALASLLAAQDPPRVHTSRPDAAAKLQLLRLPKEEDAFGFVVFGDRTGGPVEGIRVLEQAVADTNLLDPDLVLTVGDLINGYNDREAWLAQANEYKAAMARLRMPWFPVAGNHDIYWRGPGKPDGEHEADFETHFGPLWYAFQHKRCWFVVLYSDEGNPVTGKKDFTDPDCQRISDAQFTWLRDTLARAKGARHVFVFLHHPRWLPRYGDDWGKVHQELAKAGNVTAVFAGHIHRMRYDGVRDGIQYYTVASVGAHLDMEAPQAGFLHQYHVVTVRPQGITVAALPVGTVIDPQQITGELSEDVARVHHGLQVEVTDCQSNRDGPAVQRDGSVEAVVTLRLPNPGQRAIELELWPQGDAGWQFAPDHQHVVVPGGKTGSTTFLVRRRAEPAAPFALPQLDVRCDYLAADRRIALPRRQAPLPLPAPPDLGAAPAAREGVLALAGDGACLELPAAAALPQGPFTVEAWLCGEDFAGRRALVAKTEQSEYALFVSDGRPAFTVHLGGTYHTAGAAAKAPAPLQPGRWHHLAGVYDGAELRLYLDGALLGRTAAQGPRTTNQLPLLLGADPDGRGRATSTFAGRIDEARLSAAARYQGERFAPAARHEPDAATVWLLHCDEDFGPWCPDAGPGRHHAVRRGSAHCTVESRPANR